MATLTRSLRRVLCCLLVVYTGSVVFAASIGTQWEGLAHTIAGKIESYAKAHGGQLPSTLQGLYTGIDAALLEDQLRGPLSSKIVYFEEQKPQLEQDGEELLAVVAFPISEDRRPEVGRYVIYRDRAGKIGSRWESEKVIQTSVAKTNLFLPFASTYQEKPIKPLYPEYGMRLIDDARKHGVSVEQALKAVEKHIVGVTNRGEKQATTWAELVAAATPSPASRAEATPGAATPTALAAPSLTRTHAVVPERHAPVWPWVV